MAREVHEQEIGRAAVGEEVLDRKPDLLSRLISQDLNVEFANGPIAEDLGQRVSVPTGCGQPAKTVVRIVLVGNHEREPRASHPTSLQSVRADPVHSELLLHCRTSAGQLQLVVTDFQAYGPLGPAAPQPVHHGRDQTS